MKSVIIDGVEYFPRESAKRKIVVLDRGFVVVGMVSLSGSHVVIDDCACIRRWGTTKGLGQLAMDGPRKDTILDPQPRTTVHELQVVQMIDCEEASWKQ